MPHELDELAVPESTPTHTKGEGGVNQKKKVLKKPPKLPRNGISKTELAAIALIETNLTELFENPEWQAHYKDLEKERKYETGTVA